MTVAVKISLSKPMSVLDSGYCPPPLPVDFTLNPKNIAF